MTDFKDISTATNQNVMTEVERDEFLSEALVSRLTSQRSDGWPHVAPVWYVWQDGVFVHSIGAGRRHLRNIAENPLVTECIDVDYRLAGGLAAGAKAVTCFGRAEIIDDREYAIAAIEQILFRYLGPDDGRAYLEPSIAELDHGRQMIRVTPVRWVTWDYTKAG